MRHRNAFRKLNRTASHRRALFNNLAMALIEHGRIQTTDPKAKSLRGVVERLVTLGKKGTLTAKRQVYAQLGGAGKHPRDGLGPHRVQRTVEVLFGDLAARFKDRPGGYTRVVKLGNRHGDAAPMSIIEFVDFVPGERAEKTEE
jgi:large subunit ribosomal protein L17